MRVEQEWETPCNYILIKFNWKKLCKLQHEAQNSCSRDHIYAYSLMLFYVFQNIPPSRVLLHFPKTSAHMSKKSKNLFKATAPLYGSPEISV